MSDINLQKPALPGAGKPRRLFDRGDLMGLALFAGLAVMIGGFSDNPTVEEWAGKQWAGKCAAYEGHLGTVSEIEVGGNYATVTRLDGSMALDRVAVAKLTKADCPVASPPRDEAKAPQPIVLPPAEAKEPPVVVADETDSPAQRQKEIIRLKLDLEAAKLQFELARVKAAYRDFLTGSGSADAIRDQDTAGGEITENARRLDRLRMEIERTGNAHDLYNRLKQPHGEDISR
ncbi:hypothetical protein [Rhizobium sp. BK176]|uniref:hypothetical protein n=1 Tax=Rhizobium sp. BK176 TaxID=2587071 RepID=UPI00216A4450|nr:hypothetical protein [Rhizobium sp. BK176]MCS4089522.1 hypothetical protein [Rhizobium sp. BK176]